MAMTFLVIDNYDSFTYNLVHLISHETSDIKVFRNDAITQEEIRELSPHCIVISPGPCTPKEAGISIPVIKEFAGKIPIFGVCLGLQSIAMHYGFTVERATLPMHGKTSPIHIVEHPLFHNIPSSFNASRYHSLEVKPDSHNNSGLQTIASSDDNAIMAMAHNEDCVYGVQFHPESIASEYGQALIHNVYTLTQNFWNK